MAKFEKGNKLGGRKPGALNRSTEEMKLTIARAVNNTLSTIQQDLIEIKKRNPEKAMELAMRLMEYTMPKMRSLDVSGTMDINAKIQSISVNIIKGTDERVEN
jgi:autotransporter translocation and assembly factor TamB